MRDGVVEISPTVVRVLAQNPGVMTGPGTNTYLVGTDELAVIDPGPDDPAHLQRVADVGAGRIRHILVTHTHLDHAPGAGRLSSLTGAPMLGFGSGPGFVPDTTIKDGHILRLGDVTLKAIHTPGHASDHLCYLHVSEQLLFSGDHVMSGSTVVIKPLDGDMAAYIRSLKLVQALDPPLGGIAPGHGEIIEDPAAVLEAYLSHRLERESSVLSAVSIRGGATAKEIVEVVYTDVPDRLHPIAVFSVWAHLRKLEGNTRS